MTTDIRLGAYQATLQDQVETLDLIFTSPPYNIGSKSPRIDGQRRKGKYDPKSYGSITGYADNLPEDEYQRQQVEFLHWAARALKDDGTLVYNHKPRRKNGVMIHPMQWLLQCPDLTLMEEIVWDRRSTITTPTGCFGERPSVSMSSVSQKVPIDSSIRIGWSSVTTTGTSRSAAARQQRSHTPAPSQRSSRST